MARCHPGCPEMAGSHRMSNLIRPKLVVADAAAAIDFYTRVLGAAEIVRYLAGGSVVFAELALLGSSVTLKDADHYDPVLDPGPILDVLVDDPDVLAEAMLAAGASVVYEMSDQPFGGRWGRVRDPFGIQWLLQTPVTMSPEEIQRLLT